jgi:predicted negative regulator of RcsB-dependent stress response
METQEQEVEAFKKWWQDNGKVVVFGIVVGLGAIAGWNTWQSHQRQQAELASSLYAEVVNAANSGEHAQALSGAKSLLEQYPDSGYASLGALVGARSAFASQAPDEAKGQLMWVIANANVTQFQDVARLRLARLLGSEGQHDEAKTQLSGIKSASFKSMVEELRGDLALAGKDPDAAKAAYRVALESDSLDINSRRRIEVKLNDLGGEPASTN